MANKGTFQGPSLPSSAGNSQFPADDDRDGNSNFRLLAIQPHDTLASPTVFY